MKIVFLTSLFSSDAEKKVRLEYVIVKNINAWINGSVN